MTSTESVSHFHVTSAGRSYNSTSGGRVVFVVYSNEFCRQTVTVLMVIAKRHSSYDTTKISSARQIQSSTPEEPRSVYCLII
jgi:hypothetical protein